MLTFGFDPRKQRHQILGQTRLIQCLDHRQEALQCADFDAQNMRVFEYDLDEFERHVNVKRWKTSI